MKLLLQAGKFGFSDIYTSLDNNIPDDLVAFIDKDKPYLIFTTSLGFPAIANTKLKYMLKSGLLTVGLLSSNNKNIIITVNGYKNIIKAIDFFLSAEDRDDIYITQRNSSTYTKLDEFKTFCETGLTQLNKPKKNLPDQSINISELAFNSNEHRISVNSTYEVSHTKAGDITKKYIYKENKSKRSISNIEVFNSHCYQLLLDERHPEVSNVHNDAGECVGSISELIEPFQSFHDYFNKNKAFPSTQILLDSEVVKVWVAAYVEEENDLHGGNYYLAENGFCGKIDGDRSSWQHTAKYHAVHPILGSPGIYNMSPPPNSFKITQRDINSFPTLRDANPRNWPDRSDSRLLEYGDLLLEKKYQNDKFYMFLKRILIPSEVYNQIAKSILRSTKLQHKLAEHKIEKTKELSSVLVQMREFQDYIQNNQHCINDICCEFDSYNHKQANANTHIDIDAVRAEFVRISEIVANLKKQEKEETEHSIENDVESPLLSIEVAHANNNFSLFRQTSFMSKAGVACLIISMAIQNLYQSDTNSSEISNNLNLQLIIALVTTFSIIKDIYDSACNDRRIQKDVLNQRF